MNFIKSKKLLISGISLGVVVVFLAFLFIREPSSANNEENEENKDNIENEEVNNLIYMDLLKDSDFYGSDKPLVEESLISGYLTYRGDTDDKAVDLTESDAQELVALLKELKVTKVTEKVKLTNRYMVSLSNTNYPMSYQLKLIVLLEKVEDKILISSTIVPGIYELTDFIFYDKVVELLK